MKKFTLMVLALLLSLCTASFAFAADKKDDSAKIIKVYRITEDGLQEVSIEEYLNFKSETAKNFNGKVTSSDSEIEPKDVYTYYKYDESGSREVRRTDLRKRVSSYAENYTSGTVTKAISYATSQGYSLSTNLNSGELTALKSGVSFTWNSSASVSETDTMPISPYHRGWWEHDPLMYKSWGYVKKYNTLGDLLSSKYVTSYSPKKLNGHLDGYLLAMEEPL